MSAPNRDPKIIPFKERAAERNSRQGSSSCNENCFQNSPEYCPQLKKNWLSPLFIGGIIVALIGSEAIHYQADATLKAAQETGQATRDAGHETAQATLDAAAMTAKGGTLASASQATVPLQDPPLSQSISLTSGMRLSLPIRGTPYVLAPAYNNTTTLHVISGSFLLTIDKTQKIVCKAGDTIRLFWNKSPDFNLKILQKGTIAVVGDVKLGNQLRTTESSCTKTEET